MTAAEITTDILAAIANGNGFSWEAPQEIGNGEVAVHMEVTGYGIISAPHPFAGATYTVVHADGTEYDCDSTFNNAADAVALAESL